MKKTNKLTKQTCPELFSAMAQTAKELGITIPKNITIPKLAMLIEQTLLNVCRPYNYHQAA